MFGTKMHFALALLVGAVLFTSSTCFAFEVTVKVTEDCDEANDDKIKNEKDLEERVTALESKWDWELAATLASLNTKGSDARSLEFGAGLNLRMTDKLYARATTAWAPTSLDGDTKLGANSNFVGVQYRIDNNLRISAGWRSILVWDEEAEGEGDLLQAHLGELQASYVFGGGFQIGAQAGWGHGEWSFIGPARGNFPAGFERPETRQQASDWGATRVGVSFGYVFE